MIGRLFFLELRAIRSDGRLLALVAIATVLLLLSVWIGAESQKVVEHGREHAVSAAREQWEGITLTAHSAAHFGNYVYKPAGALATLDSGVMPFTGKVIRVEAHVQHPPSYSDASTWSSLVRLGAFDAGTILSYIVPLLLIFTIFSSVSRDRETGLLRALVAQGIKLQSILTGKVLAYWALALLLVLILTAAHVVIDLSGGGSLTSDTVARIAGFSISHSMYLLVVVMLSVWISARIAEARAALAILTIAWLGSSVLLPRVASELGSQLYRLDSQVTFEDAMKEDRSKGIDGHNPSDKRRAAFRKKVLEEYGVTDYRQLPVNIGGLLMQADEEYGNKVWDKHFGERHETVRKQIGVVQTASFINPFLAIRGLSMAFAGTDQFHDTQFQRQAEDYRREMVRTLNDLDAKGGKRENGRWIRDKVNYAEIEDFSFQPQTMGFALQNRWPELVALFVWLSISIFLVRFSVNRIPIVGASR